MLITGESRALRRAWILAAALGGILAAASSDSSRAWKLAWICLTAGVTAWACRTLKSRDGQLRLERTGRACWRSGSERRVSGTVAEEAWLTPWLSVLKLRTDDGRRIPFLVQVSRQAPDAYRRMLVRLRYPPGAADR